MRTDMIADFIKEEWYSQRRLLFWYCLTSLILGLLFIYASRNGWVLNQVENHAGLSLGEFSLTALVLLFIAYVISWVFLSTKTDMEIRSGFYPFLHTLPITIKEIVTAKYMANFLMNGLMIAWLCGIWWIYELSFPDAASLTAWTVLCTLGLFYAFSVLAVHMAFFFRWGSGSVIYVFLLLLIVVSQFEFADQLFEQIVSWMDRSPFLFSGIAILLTACIWITCWNWSVKAYRKY
ncbi:ABC-2 transporter permease [Lentibacillus sp. CBA3610]|uniref:ABC-2 transporter permease n=1 Tax=Lentibacillus sp. CBA3610 TaxID=2518176 RepID=UPI0015962F95|nr:ABC-2 transporter permease [Lentibacillus sp. CBA3610]QKY68824.1 hypothetical protein Len3610_03610 [Lentibacillus sp. CBA3610]